MLGDHSAPRDGRCALTSSSPRDARPRPVQLHAQHVRPCHPGARASGGRAVGCRACGRLRGLAGRLTARRGQRRGQGGLESIRPGRNRGGFTRSRYGADTEIRTQDLLFTKQLHSSRPRESKRQSSRLESHAGTTSMACRGPTTRSGSGHDIGPGRPAADRSGAAALVADAGVSGTSRVSAPCPRGPWTIRRRSRPTVALLEIRATMRPCTQKRRVRAAMTSFAAPSAASPGPGDPRAPDASSPPS